VLRIVVDDADGPSAEVAGSRPFAPFGPDRFVPVDHDDVRPRGGTAPAWSPR
jgi:hypothetical protein